MLLADEQIDWGNEEADGEVLWALTDHLGTVRDVIDNGGTVVDHAQYDAFGNRLNAAAVDLLFGYTGKPFDEATGLQNNLHRWYDPAVGRWVSEDPIGFDGGDANLTRYVGNETTLSIDPDGLASWNCRRLLHKIQKQREFVQDLPRKISKLTPEEQELILDLGQLSLDVVGIFEPTPVCDVSSGLISLYRLQFFDALVSGLGVIPYFGDVAKLGKLPRYLATISKAVRIAEISVPVRRIVLPLLEQTKEILRLAPYDYLPKSVVNQLSRISDSLDEAIGRLRACNQKKVAPKIDSARKTREDARGTFTKSNDDELIDKALNEERTMIEQQLRRRKQERDFRRRKDTNEPDMTR